MKREYYEVVKEINVEKTTDFTPEQLEALRSKYAEDLANKQITEEFFEDFINNYKRRHFADQNKVLISILKDRLEY